VESSINRAQKRKRQRWRGALALALISTAAAIGFWSLVLFLGDGARFQLDGIRISSRNPVRPAVLAMVLVAAAWRLKPGRLSEVARRLLLIALPARSALVPVAACAVAVVGLGFGGRAAVAADAYGYISQSLLWMRGDLRMDQAFAAGVPWPNADWTFSPLGYRPGPNHVLVPTYAPGLPLLMAATRLLGECGPFFVVPLSGAVLTLATWSLGRRFFRAETAVVGTLFTAASPVVLASAVVPMSDVPAAAFWTTALLSADVPSVRAAGLAGALSGMAILIRPNLAPLAAFPLLLTMLRGGGMPKVLARTATLAAATALLAGVVAGVNAHLYGSPFSSGYGRVSTIYSLSYFKANLARYPAWWWHAHGLLGWLFLVNVFRPRLGPPDSRRLVLIGFAVAVVGLYAFYLPFEQWIFLRFMLPALPVIMLFVADAVVWMTDRSTYPANLCILAGVVALAILSGVHLARSEGLFRNAVVNQQHADAGLYIDAFTPQKTVVLAMQYSGSVRYYSGRLTLRYDLLEPNWLDRALQHFDALGFVSYALLEDWEVQEFRRRFVGQKEVERLRAAPVAIRRNTGGDLKLYALRDHVSSTASMPAEIPRTSRFDCVPASHNFLATTQLQP
jgi:hypothetical protein